MSKIEYEPKTTFAHKIDLTTKLKTFIWQYYDESGWPLIGLMIWNGESVTSTTLSLMVLDFLFDDGTKYNEWIIWIKMM